jgi:hypothetical protein
MRDQAFLEGSSNLFRTEPADWLKASCVMGGQISGSLSSLRSSCDTPFQKYDMNGEQGAKTTVRLPGGQLKTLRTTAQMHSEMRAIEWMIDQGHWTVYLGNVVWIDGSSVTPEQFSTKEPHCGYCSLFLIAAGLPVCTPTCGNHQLASRFSYKLPVALEISPHFIARVLDSGCYCGFPTLKRLLNEFIQVPSEKWLLSIYDLAYVSDHSYVMRDPSLLIVDWSALVEMHKREVIYLAWKVIFKLLMDSNNKGGQ